MASAKKQGSKSGPALVIVESPAKAKTISKYLEELGAFHVEASKGHVRDLPTGSTKAGKADENDDEATDDAGQVIEAAPTRGKGRATRGAEKAKPTGMQITGVDLETFQATYIVNDDKRDTISKLRMLSKGASEVWFATDLDREGEAISWHIADELNLDVKTAKRVVFNAITRAAIQEAFAHPRGINMSRVNAQNARRILDRILGYGVSPLLWRVFKTGGLSAGRVQTVAARLVTEREEDIRDYVPDERWELAVRLSPALDQREALASALHVFLHPTDAPAAPPNRREQLAWLSANGIIEAKLVELDGKKCEFTAAPSSDEPPDLTPRVRQAAEAAGLEDLSIALDEHPKARGAARFVRTIQGTVGKGVRYHVGQIETIQKSRRPEAPFKTSTLQMAASSQNGFSTERTMRIAQSLYEGVDVDGERVGLITYMRTDSVSVAPEAIDAARAYVRTTWGSPYLPEKPFVYASSKDAQEAHEAIRPTDPARTPESVRDVLSDEQFALYTLVWRRFLASQMSPKVFEQTTVRFERSDKATGAVLRASGSVVVFDGYMKLVEDEDSSEEEATFPRLATDQTVAAVGVEPIQRFGSPPARYSEASLVRELEAKGIGRPSTYASTIKRIEDKKYVEQRNRRFFATGLGESVVSILVGGFPALFDYETTRRMEERLDRIENDQEDWRAILREVKAQLEGEPLETAFKRMSQVPLWRWSPWACLTCGKRLRLRYGKGGRFLGCSGYPECTFTQPVNNAGEPATAAGVDILCPVDQSEMTVREGSFGPFISSVNYPKVKYIIKVDAKKRTVTLPVSPPIQDPEVLCSKCGRGCNIRQTKRGPWLTCSGFPKCRGRGNWKALSEAKQADILAAIERNQVEHPPHILRRRDGSEVTEGTLVAALYVAGSEVTLPMHPDGKQPPPEGAEGYISTSRAAEAIAQRVLAEVNAK